MTESDQGTARRSASSTVERTSHGSARTSDRADRTVSRTSAGNGERGRVRTPVRARREQGPASTASSTTTTTTTKVPAAKKSAGRKPRRAQLRLSQVDAWSVMKTAFLLSIAMGIVTVVAVGIVWSVLGAAGVFDSLNSTVQTVMGNGFQIQDYIGTGRVLGFTMLVAVVDVVLLTAIATLVAFLYNLAATLLGGVEVTLTEDS